METSNLNDILSEYSKWNLGIDTKPEIQHQLKTGLTNTSYVITANQKSFKLRINAINSVNLGINRAREATILARIAPLKITPQHYFNEEHQRYSIFEYIDGKVWQASDLALTENKKRLLRIIHLYQTLSFSSPPRNYLKYLQHYQSQIPNDKLTNNEWQIFFQFMKLLEESTEQWPTPVLCHHDLIPSNIIERDNRLYILDWEYAALGWGELDYLSSGLHDNINHPLSKQLHYWLNKLWHVINFG